MDQQEWVQDFFHLGWHCVNW